jgi:hypothetical protein
MTKKRRRVKQSRPLAERLYQFANDVRDQARHLPEGDARNQLLEKAQVTERAIELETLLSSR